MDKERRVFKIYEVQAHAQKVTCLDLGETGRVLVTGGYDRNVNLWTIGSVECINTLSGHNVQVDCVKFTKEDNFVFSADAIGIIKRWDLNHLGSGCSTFFGHMKSVRTLDFHPFGDYVASGSNDTTVRLWDIRKSNTCFETYRGHIANVNSVKFSPDGSWIASAGTEGCLVIWDIRMRKKIIEFQEHASPITCIQFHPFEFLIAAGRNDGTVDLYDLESKKLICRTDSKSAFSGHTVKCITFSEDGKCLFVGTAEGVSVIGWEPDKAFDHIESEWSILGDMKVINKKLFCMSFEGQTVNMHKIDIDKVAPFYNVTSQPFSYNQTARKSFSRTNSALKRLSIVKSASNKKIPNLNGSSVSSTAGNPPLARTDGELSSPSSLSFELIDEEPAVSMRNGFNFENYARDRNQMVYSASSSPSVDHYLETPPNSMPTDDTPAAHDRSVTEYIGNYNGDLDFYPMRSSPGSRTVVEPERDDFPINNATPPDYAPKIDIALHLSKTSLKHKQQIKPLTHSSSTNTVVRRHSPSNNSGARNNLRKYSLTSMSTMDLHRATDESLLNSTYTNKKTTGVARSRSPVRNYIHANNNGQSQPSSTANNNTTVKYRRNDTAPFAATNAPLNREHNTRSKKIPVQIYETPVRAPLRSKTSLDLRASGPRSSAPTSPNTKRKTMHFNQNPQPSRYTEGGDDGLTMLVGQHEKVMQHLNQRYTTLQLLRNLTISEDVIGTLKQAVKMRDPSLLVDLFGIVLETSSIPWSLDLVLLLMPEVYDLLCSDNRFHITRGCNMLTLMIERFLPIIQENTDPYGPPCSLGVDITAEERRSKCFACRNWLLRIKALPDNEAQKSSSLGKSGLVEVQNLIAGL